MNIRNWAKATLVVAFALGVAGASAQAASPKPSACKGLDQKACTAKADCSWIGATKRKDGRDVKAYCRLKSHKSAAASTPSKK